jgi:hypothetical protein
MTNTEKIRFSSLVANVSEAFEKHCPSSLKALIEKDSKPALLPRNEKTGRDKMAVKLLPVGRTPPGLWGRKVGYYEIAVGTIGEPFSPLHLAQVQFFYDPGPATDERSKYEGTMIELFESVSKAHPRFMYTHRPIKTGRNYRYLCTCYDDEDSIGKNAAFDLILLIAETLSRVHAISV